jgi:hypothetical protein
MNEKLKKLAEQAGLEEQTVHGDWSSLNYPDVRGADLERFAELVLQNYVSQIMTTEEREENIRSDEREACAALVEADGRVHPKAPDAIWAKTVAKLIRARGEHD